MSFLINDNTAASQRFAVDNSGNTELGAATPSASLSVNGHPVLRGTAIAAQTAAPASMPRITGGMSINNGNVQTINIAGTTSGFGTVDGPGLVVGYASGNTQVTFACTTPTFGTSNINYGSF